MPLSPDDCHGAFSAYRLFQDHVEPAGHDLDLAQFEHENGDEQALVAGTAYAAERDRRVTVGESRGDLLAGDFDARFVPENENVRDMVRDRGDDAFGLEVMDVLQDRFDDADPALIFAQRQSGVVVVEEAAGR